MSHFYYLASPYTSHPDGLEAAWQVTVSGSGVRRRSARSRPLSRWLSRWLTGESPSGRAVRSWPAIAAGRHCDRRAPASVRPFAVPTAESTDCWARCGVREMRARRNSDWSPRFGGGRGPDRSSEPFRPAPRSGTPRRSTLKHGKICRRSCSLRDFAIRLSDRVARCACRAPGRPGTRRPRPAPGPLRAQDPLDPSGLQIGLSIGLRGETVQVVVDKIRHAMRLACLTGSAGGWIADVEIRRRPVELAVHRAVRGWCRGRVRGSKARRLQRRGAGRARDRCAPRRRVASRPNRNPAPARR